MDSDGKPLDHSLDTAPPPEIGKSTGSDSSGGASSSPVLDDPLRVFQQIVGIGTPTSITKPTELAEKGNPYATNSPNPLPRPKANKGIYQNVVELQTHRQWEYISCTILINSCILAQIAFAAILTALGASEAPHNVITVFGTMNVAIAGILALLKGQGLPDRLRQDWVGLTKVRDYIEERERLLEQQVVLEYSTKGEDGKIAVTKEDLMKEVKAVLAIYDSQLATMEANRPDTYVFPGEGATTGVLPRYTLGSSFGGSAGGST